MGTYRAESWGRTRRPKEMSEDVPPSKQTAVTLTTVASGALSHGLTGSNPGTNGYVTENQRFLHIQIEDDNTDETIKLFVYNYAFGKWAPLYIPVGVKDSADTGAQDAYVQAAWNGVNGVKQITVPIHGIDRVAFVDDGSHNATLVVRAACSTF